MNQPEDTDRVVAAYEAALSDMRALDESELAHVNLDIPSAVATTLGAWKELVTLRDKVATLPEFDLDRFDKLETYALAAWHAHTLYLAAAAPTAPLQELSEEATTTRQMLLADANALATRGLLNPERLKDLKGPIGYKNVAVDIAIIVAILRERWDTIAGKTALSSAELNRANKLADQLMTAVGEREQAPARMAEAAQNRERAFTLLLRTYDQARRAMIFLRWSKQDVDNVAPSLYAGRASRRRGTGEDTVEPMTAVITPPPSASPTQTPQTIPVGFPGTSPFGPASQ